MDAVQEEKKGAKVKIHAGEALSPQNLLVEMRRRNGSFSEDGEKMTGSTIKSRGFSGASTIGVGKNVSLPRLPFSGLEAHSLQCLKCKSFNLDLKYTEFLNLNLVIPNTSTNQVRLEDCLSHYTRPELIEDYKCERCSRLAMEPTYTTIRKRIMIGRFPKALCLHLQIAVAGYDDSFSPYKVMTKVWFREQLDMAPFHVSAQTSDEMLTTKEIQNRRRVSMFGGNPDSATPVNHGPYERTISPAIEKDVPYLLCAVIVHHGSGVGSGHFTAYRRLIRDEKGRYEPAEIPSVIDLSSKMDLDSDFVQGIEDILEDRKIDLSDQVDQFSDGQIDEFVKNSPVQSRADDIWISISDADVRVVSKEEVLRSHAYMLFYEKMDEEKNV